MPELTVHLLDPPAGEELARLRDLLAPGVHLTCGPELPEPPCFQTLVAGRPTREQLAASPNLRYLVIPWAGLPPGTRELAREFPALQVHNLHHNAAPTAEHGLALLFPAAKHLIPMDRVFRQHDWRPRYAPSPSILLHGKSALILGFGAIGQRLGRYAHALGMRVLAVRRNPDKPGPDDYPAEVYAPDALPELLPRANVLLIALPGVPATDGLLGAAELALLPARALLVNIGRAAVVDQAALFAALQDGRLGGAGLDVWYHYPQDEAGRAATPPADFPFHELDNVVLSPHRAGGGGGEDVEALRMQALAELLNAAARGETPPNRVDLQAGY